MSFVLGVDGGNTKGLASLVWQGPTGQKISACLQIPCVPADLAETSKLSMMPSVPYVPGHLTAPVWLSLAVQLPLLTVTL